MPRPTKSRTARAGNGPVDRALEVVPMVAGQDMYLRFPMEIATDFAGDEQDHGVQFTLKGDGFPGRSPETPAGVFLRARDREKESVLSYREEYWARYTTDAVSEGRGPVLWVVGSDQSGTVWRGTGFPCIVLIARCKAVSTM